MPVPLVFGTDGWRGRIARDLTFESVARVVDAMAAWTLDPSNPDPGDPRSLVIVHDTRFIEANAPRFIGLLRQYGHAMTVYRTGAAARAAMDPLLIVDARHHLHRFHIDQPRASVAIEEPQATKPLVTRFEEIWATGEPGLAGTVLGL